MIFEPIQDLEIFDTAYDRSGIWASVRVDTVPLYGLFFPGVRKLSSGKQTIGAFENGDKHSLVAWIDPVSDRFVSLRPNWLYTVPGSLFLTLLLGGCILALLNLWLLHIGTAIDRRLTALPTLAVLLVCGVMITLCLFDSSKKTILETRLRRELERYKIGGTI
ncbi:hypothetical protein V8G57_13250 [Collimonas sp. H4R21]|uniref:Uncharacterized protein n=1 Tax=Collimonas rhizosphaerae TaxID=3126357 RepID=A0ABU9PWI7_9BURK